VSKVYFIKSSFVVYVMTKRCFSGILALFSFFDNGDEILKYLDDFRAKYAQSPILWSRWCDWWVFEVFMKYCRFVSKKGLFGILGLIFFWFFLRFLTNNYRHNKTKLWQLFWQICLFLGDPFCDSQNITYWIFGLKNSTKFIITMIIWHRCKDRFQVLDNTEQIWFGFP